MIVTFLTQYDTFSESLRTFVTNNRTKSHKKDINTTDNTNNDSDYDTLFLYRQMKFIKKPAKQPSKYPVLIVLSQIHSSLHLKTLMA